MGAALEWSLPAVSIIRCTMNRRTNLAVDAFVKGNTKTPPVDLGVISISFVHFRGKVGQGTGLACERFSGSEIRCDVLQWLVSFKSRHSTKMAYKISQMDVSFGIQENVIRLDIAMNDTLRVNIPQGATHLSNPELDGLLRKTFSRDMESQVTAVHQINHDIASQISTAQRKERPFVTHMYSISWKLYRKLQRKGWSKCSSILRSRIIFRTLSDLITKFVSTSSSKKTQGKYPLLSEYISEQTSTRYPFSRRCEPFQMPPFLPPAGGGID